MRVLRVLAVLTVGVAASAAAQLSTPPPTEKLLVLPLSVTTPADSAASIAATDAARARIIQLVRYKANVIPKQKICEVLAQSGFSCDALITDQQAAQLSRALNINSYTSGVLIHTGNQYGAKVRVISGASGFASSFVTSGAATPAALGEAIAQRIATVIKAAEFSRNCNEQRSHSALDRALGEARKAFAIEPNLAAANLCMATVFEVQKAPLDSQIAAFRRARQGDAGNSEAWSREAAILMVKGDTAGALTTFDSLLSYNPSDKNLRLALAGQMLQHKSYGDAQQLVDEGLKLTPGDQQLLDQRKRICLDGAAHATDPAVARSLSTCLLKILRQEADADSTKLADTNNLKLAIGTAQTVSDTAAYIWWARAATRHYPTSVAFIKQLAGAYLLAGQMDSALAYYQKALAQNPNDVPTSLLIAKTIVDNAVWDTSKAGPCQRNKDTVCLRTLREAFVPKVDPARQYLAVGFASPDSGLKLTTAVVALSGGSKLAQATAYDAAYPWLDQLLTQIAPRSPADTTGPRQQIRAQANFWLGISTALSLGPPYAQMVKEKSCDQARAVNERIVRGIQSIDMGGRVAPTVAAQMRGILMQYQVNMPKVKQAFKCKNF